MCEVCRESPCNPRCPNAPDPIVLYHCVNCGAKITEGDAYYDICGDEWCCDCIEDCRKYAELEEYCEEN